MKTYAQILEELKDDLPKRNTILHELIERIKLLTDEASEIRRAIEIEMTTNAEFILDLESAWEKEHAEEGTKSERAD